MTPAQQHLFIQLDQYIDYIPVLSTLSNTIDLFLKAVVLSTCTKKDVQDNHYFTHLQSKSTARCIALLVPVIGNIFVGVLDYVQASKKTTLYEINEHTDRQKVIDLVKKGYPFCDLPLKWRNDFTIAKAAVQRNSLAFEWVSEEFRDNEDLVAEALARKCDSFYPSEKDCWPYVSERLQNHRDAILRFVTINGNLLEFVSKEFQNDKEIVLAALQKFVAFHIQRDQVVFKTKPRQNVSIFQFASDMLKCNKEFIIKVLEDYGDILEYASADLRSDSEVVKVAVKQNGLALRHALPSGITKEVVGTALEQNGWALKHAPYPMQCNKELVMKALENEPCYGGNECVIQFASPQLKNDDDVMALAIKKNPMSLYHADEKWRNNRKVVLEAVEKNLHALCFLGKTLCNDRSIYLHAIQKHPGVGRYFIDDYLPPALKNDSEILAALKLKESTD